MLDERKTAILAALVEEHISSGVPVSSQAILDRAGLACSSATVRNELAVLERDGMASKPHTSSGRVPTDRGYRHYLDHVSAGSLRTSTRHRIDDFFGNVHDELGRILRQTTDLLSDITHYPAVVLGPGLGGQTLRDLHLLPVDPATVLLVVVTDSGMVHQAVLRPQAAATPAELAAARPLLAGILADLLVEPEKEPETRVDASAPVSELVELSVSAVADVVAGSREVYVGGASRTMSLWEDLSQLHRILELLEREAVILDMLDDAAGGTTVRLGTELGAAEDDLAIVSTPYETGAVAGRMGVLGPMRMDYRRTIRVVEEVSDALGDSLGG